jgi:hypothetical protein
VEQAEADRKRDEQSAVALADGVVDGDLHVERTGQHEELHDNRQHQRLAKGATDLGDAADQCAHADALDFALLFELRRRRELERDAGHVLRQFIEIIRARAQRGIVDRHFGATDRLQHDEVVEIPVQDGWQPQLFQMHRLESQRPAGEAQPARDIDQALKRDALNRDRKAPPQRVEIEFVAMVSGDHGEACEPAFRHFGLQDHRQTRAAGEIQKFADRTHDSEFARWCHPQKGGRGQVCERGSRLIVMVTFASSLRGAAKGRRSNLDIPGLLRCARNDECIAQKLARSAFMTGDAVRSRAAPAAIR